MLRLAAFADEISPDLEEQAFQCARLGVTGIELRSVGGRNVLDLDAAAAREIARVLADRGLAVICIGSPIGKVAIDQPFEAHLERFRRAVERAHWFKTRLIRVFSFYPGGDGRLDVAEVLSRFRTFTDLARRENVVLVHENEKDIFGDTAERCHALLAGLNSPHLRAAFDFANFVQVGEDPWRAWVLLRDHVAHIHIKDARAGTGNVVPAGEGDGRVAEILRDARARGYDGYLSLEPHLAAAGQFSGFSGPALFEVAVNALRGLLDREAIA